MIITFWVWKSEKDISKISIKLQRNKKSSNEGYWGITTNRSFYCRNYLISRAFQMQITSYHSLTSLQQPLPLITSCHWRCLFFPKNTQLTTKNFLSMELLLLFLSKNIWRMEVNRSIGSNIYSIYCGPATNIWDATTTILLPPPLSPLPINC